MLYIQSHKRCMFNHALYMKDLMVVKILPSYYRHDIDGLRALAVLAGLLFQAHVPGFDSGFVSVDIFFVISGFLITSIILRQLQSKRFSFRTFYLRRFRRILPALAVMLIVTLILSWFVLLPEDFKLLGRHVAATILMVPNISIWEASRDYFAPTVDTNPLLDLWSLGVEEQFYLLTPGLLIILIRYVSLIWIGRVFAGLLAGSFGFAIWLAIYHPSIGYYWSPPRAWELFFGVGLAYFHFVRQPTNSQPTNKPEWLAVGGLAAIIASIVVPGSTIGVITLVHQLAAVLGTTLLIHLHSFRQTLVSRFLSCKFLVGIGLISYPLYLWRWPLFSLRSYWHSSEGSSWSETLFLLMLCFGLSYLTWRWIEQPASQIPIHPSKSLIKSVVTTQLVLLVAGVILWHSNGLIWRFSPAAIAYADGIKDVNPLRKTCHNLFSLDSCSFAGTKEEYPSFMIRGSSYADAITPVFHACADQYALKGIQSSSNVAPFLVDVQFINLPLSHNKNREELSLSALKVVEKYNIKDIFLVGSWAGYIKLGLTSSNSLDSMKAFQEGMEKAVSLLVSKGKRVWIVLQVPSIDKQVPRWLALHAAEQSDVWIDNPYPEDATNLRPFFDRLSKQYGAILLDPLPHLCRADGKCHIAHKGKAVYLDQGHLSASGSLLLEEMLRPAFELMKQRK
jgi:peptidoglycan/LPS O-acetylase OafA/YrhL